MHLLHGREAVKTAIYARSMRRDHAATGGELRDVRNCQRSRRAEAKRRHNAKPAATGTYAYERVPVSVRSKKRKAGKKR